MPSLLLVAPLADEAKAICGRLAEKGFPGEVVRVGNLTCTAVAPLDMVIAIGGTGKAQFGVQAQHLLDHNPEAKLLVCVGAAGRLSEELSVGDVVVGSYTIEHDYLERFLPEPLPHHEGDPAVIGELQRIAASAGLGFRVHVGPIASGDEDIVDITRRREVYAATHALCVAWEGSGGARAARFSGVGFVEIRVITDVANPEAASAFHENLATVMPHIADVLVAWRSGQHAVAS
jgi:adenosylhomocysteine nucleosidase